MRPIPAYKYLTEGCTIQFDFVKWQEEHRHIDCYLTVANCLMVPALAETRYIIQIWDHTGTIYYHNRTGWDRSSEVMRMKYPEPPRDATALPAPGFAADPSTYPQPTGPPPVIRHDDSLNGDWKDFGPDLSNATKTQIPCGLHHIAKPGRTKTNWALDGQTLEGTGSDKPIYLKISHARERKLIRICA